VRERNCDNDNRSAAKVMKTTSHEPNAIHMPPELLAAARQAAE
jgi:hypothetical protein